MSPAELLWTLAFLLGFVQGVFLAAVLLTKRASHRGPAVLLALLVLTFALMIGEEIVDTAGLYETWPHAALSTFTLSLAIGPLILLYTRRITEPQRRLRARELLHFTPMVAVGAYMAPFYVLAAGPKLAVLREGLGSDIDALVLAKCLQVVTYQTLAVHLTGRLLDQADPTTRPHLKWFRRMLVTTLGPGIFIHLIHFYPRLAVFSGADSDRVGSLILTAIIYAFAIAAMRRPFFWGARTDDEPRERTASPAPPPKYATSPLDSSSEQSCLEALRRHMELDAPYRDPDLRLADVAAALGVSPHVLSQTINELAGANFYALVNEYRVAAVKQMMADAANDRRNLLALAFDAGFNSKTTFNRVFKTNTGMTPSDYRRELGGTPARRLCASHSPT